MGVSATVVEVTAAAATAAAEVALARPGNFLAGYYKDVEAGFEFLDEGLHEYSATAVEVTAAAAAEVALARPGNSLLGTVKILKLVSNFLMGACTSTLPLQLKTRQLLLTTVVAEVVACHCGYYLVGSKKKVCPLVSFRFFCFEELLRFHSRIQRKQFDCAHSRGWEFILSSNNPSKI